MNNWYVITGAPCSGKTTVINKLKERGYNVLHEIPRMIIDEELALGKTIEQIRTHGLLFQKKILRRRLAIEKRLSEKKIIFFDRAIPDSMAYYRFLDLPDDGLLQQAVEQCRYKKVFIFESVSYQTDYARKESPEQAGKLHQLLIDSYRKLPIPSLKIPMMPIEDRIALILKNL